MNLRGAGFSGWVLGLAVAAWGQGLGVGGVLQYPSSPFSRPPASKTRAVVNRSQTPKTRTPPRRLQRAGSGGPGRSLFVAKVPTAPLPFIDNDRVRSVICAKSSSDVVRNK